MRLSSQNIRSTHKKGGKEKKTTRGFVFLFLLTLKQDRKGGVGTQVVVVVVYRTDEVAILKARLGFLSPVFFFPGRRWDFFFSRQEKRFWWGRRDQWWDCFFVAVSRKKRSASRGRRRSVEGARTEEEVGAKLADSTLGGGGGDGFLKTGAAKIFARGRGGRSRGRERHRNSVALSLALALARGG